MVEHMHKTTGRLPNVIEQRLMMALYHRGPLALKEIVSLGIVMTPSICVSSLLQKGFLLRESADQEASESLRRVRLTAAGEALCEVGERFGLMSEEIPGVASPTPPKQVPVVQVKNGTVTASTDVPILNKPPRRPLPPFKRPPLPPRVRRA
jgi:hypothetical protein